MAHNPQPPSQLAAPRILGDLAPSSGCRPRPYSGTVDVGVRSIAGTRDWPSLSGLSPAGRCPMTTAAPSTALVMIQPVFTDAERLALAGFLAGYRGLTREAYALDLRQFST